MYPGQWVVAGKDAAELADLGCLVVETTDLSERDVPALMVGQPANVEIEALGLSISGRLTEIAPLADTLGGDVVYQVTVELDSRPDGLRAGMSVDVAF